MQIIAARKMEVEDFLFGSPAIVTQVRLQRDAWTAPKVKALLSEYLSQAIMAKGAAFCQSRILLNGWISLNRWG
jgi:hypothetical protein